MNQPFQRMILQRVLDHYTKQSDAVAALSELFDLGKDAIYRRLRGDSLLTPEELKMLAEEYSLSLDSMLFEGGTKVFFTFSAFAEEPTSIEAYLDSVHAQVEQANSLPDMRFYYASMEVPIFHYLYFHELIAFKLYLWGKLTWNLPFLRDRPFSFDLIPYPILQKSDAILEWYNRMPSTELWTMSFLDNTLNQIEYISTIDQFADPKDSLVLCDRLADLIAHTSKMAGFGRKFSVAAGPDGAGAAFDLYHNEMLSTNNTMLVSSPAGKYIYTTFANPNFMVSSDPRLCNYSEKWLKTTISKSVSIGPNAEKNRIWYFRRLSRKLEIVRQRLQQELDI